MNFFDQEKKDLIEHRLKQAFESAETAELLISFEKSAAAVNRIYYAAFYSLLALGLKYNFKTSKHLQLIGWFNKTFIATGRIDKEFGRILRDCYNYRISADYDSYYCFEKADVNVLFFEMKSFIGMINLYLKENQ